jgi:hypothetical protein
MRHLAAGFGGRARARIKAAIAPGDPRLFIKAVLAEALPDDEDSRVFLVLYTAYLVLSLTDPALDIQPLAGSSDVVAGRWPPKLRAARDSGRMPSPFDPEREAISLLALSAGLGNLVLGRAEHGPRGDGRDPLPPRPPAAGNIAGRHCHSR